MALRVGLPRGLLYYYYGSRWEDFLRRLGGVPLVSGETTRATVEAGSVVDEVCLPVKVFFGHVRDLADRVDYLFVPRIVSVAAGQYSCPKMLALPDLLRRCFTGLPPIIDITVNLRRGRYGFWQTLAATGRVFGCSPSTSLWAWYLAGKPRPPYFAAGEAICGDGRPRVALIGHPYILFDRQVSMDAVNRLRGMAVDLLLPEMVGALAEERFALRLTKPIYWHYCHRLAGAALALIYSARPLDGAIFLTSFACGPDSLVGEIIRRHADRHGVPFLLLAVDEHTAETGFITRLEAFIDMVIRRKQAWL